MNAMTEAVLKSGIITPNMLQEMKRFSPTLDRDAETSEPKELEEAARLIADALESAEYALVKETDLEVLRQYIDTSVEGFLHIEALDAKPVEVIVTYGRTKLGEYIIAWRGDSIADVITNGMTYLSTLISHPDEVPEDVYFRDMRELWFGDNKAFILCVPSLPVKGSNGHSA